MFVEKSELDSLIKNKIDYNSKFGKKATDNFFCFDGSAQAFSEKMKPYMRDSKNYLFLATNLHIFVVTNACNMKCVYCQAQNGKCLPNGFMDKPTAKRAVDIALSSPSKYLSFEFQGGEPLMNFEIIKYIVEYTKSVNKDKVIDFNIVTNLTLMSDEIAKFIKNNDIGISTSLDGDALLHNRNRVYRNGEGTYDDVLSGIGILEDQNIYYGAIQTTTKYSLHNAKGIIDSYLKFRLPCVFIRNLTPLGCANSGWKEIGYTPEQFIAFYKECFDYILEINEKGTYLKEGHASIFLSKILNGVSANYMELRSPCGGGLGQIAYYYDGAVYTCDEGRMLAEMGDDCFKLGTVENSYDELVSNKNCNAVCISGIIESLPKCCDCVYQPYCGTCPVVNYALKKSIYNNEPNDYKCKIYGGILDIIFAALQDKDKKKILSTWI